MKRILVFTLFLVLFFLTYAELNADVGAHFRQLMVVDNGRVMPLDSYARIVLRRLSGRQAIAGKSAADWMADLMMRPQLTTADTVFLIDHPEILSALGLPGEKRARMSFQQLKPFLNRLSDLARSAFNLEPAKRSVVENGLLQLYENVYLFVSLRDSFICFLPHEDFAVSFSENRQLLGLKEQETPHAFADLFLQKEVLITAVSGMGSKDPESLTPVQNELRKLSGNVQEWEKNVGNSPLHVLPEMSPDQAWSPVSAALVSSHPFHQAIPLWRQALDAYRDGRTCSFNETLAAFNRLIHVHPVAAPLAGRIGREVFYNHLDPFFWSRIAYGASLVFLLLSFLFWPAGMRKISLFALTTGLLVHTLGLVLRFLITQRSPVTNLYETFLFVAWLAVIIGLFLGVRKHLPLCLTTSGSSGLAFLIIAARFGTGDTMGQLVAVLNSNWWLSVHVITITAGYAGCVVAGVIGHVLIGQLLGKKAQPDVLIHTERTLHATLIFGLFFTFLGTVMGGIWADQSWGRFWGWDPKENGALVIILWVAIILHARLAGMISRFGFAAGAIGSIIMVVLAWFGVNLLGVGMHSYGFISGIAKGLALFVLVEILFVLASALKFHKKRLSI